MDGAVRWQWFMQPFHCRLSNVAGGGGDGGGSKYQGDVDTILAKCYDNGWNYWTTPDRRLSGRRFPPFKAR